MEEIEIITYRAPRGRDSTGRAIAPGRQEVEVITGGRGYFDLEGQVLQATMGSVLWHLPGERTIYKSDREHPYECLVFVFAYAPGSPRPAPRFSRWSSAGACRDFSEEILKHFHGENPNRSLLADYAFNVLRWQASLWERARGDSGLSLPLQRAVGLIERRFAEPIAIDEIACEAGLSAAHLHALFRARLGTTPHQRLMEVRLAEARRLLATTRRSIKDIGASVGYADAVTFCKSFKARCGCRPLEYRERHIRKDVEDAEKPSLL